MDKYQIYNIFRDDLLVDRPIDIVVILHLIERCPCFFVCKYSVVKAMYKVNIVTKLHNPNYIEWYVMYLLRDISC